MSAPARDLAELTRDFSLLIDGERSTGSANLDVINPATSQVFARCPAAGRADLDRAVAAARRAFPAWRDSSYADRAQRIGRLCQSLRERSEELAYLLTMEQGKPLQQAKDEITRAANQSEGLTRIAIQPQLLEDNDRQRIELQF